ncbi:MAG: hypothetical protein HC890_05565 [Chloroflexaceae bacterium]|nr:hypothetical protein [Chloroflexaceae bacterium]
MASLWDSGKVISRRQYLLAPVKVSPLLGSDIGGDRSRLSINGAISSLGLISPSAHYEKRIRSGKGLGR